MATFRLATIAGEQMENPVFTGPPDIYSVYWMFLALFSAGGLSGGQPWKPYADLPEWWKKLYESVYP
jgi:hypothetical protein